MRMIELNTFADGVRIAVNVSRVVTVRASERNSCTLRIAEADGVQELRVREDYADVVKRLTERPQREAY